MIAVGSVPAVRAFWVGYIVETGVYSRFVSLVSQISLTSSKKHSQSPSNPASASQEYINEYVTLKNQNSIPVTYELLKKYGR